MNARDGRTITVRIVIVGEGMTPESVEFSVPHRHEQALRRLLRQAGAAITVLLANPGAVAGEAAKATVLEIFERAKRSPKP